MNRAWIPLAICLVSGGHLTGQTSAQDETTVRAVYAKLSIAMRMHATRQYLYQSSSFGSGIGDVPEITLSQIATGPLSDILARPVGEFVTYPSGLVLNTRPDEWTTRDQAGHATRATIVAAEWKAGDYLPVDWSVTVAQAVQGLESSYSRYASFAVKLSFAGRQREYVALFLFGQDASGAPVVMPGDQVIGASTLDSVIRHSVGPGPLLASFPTHPLVKELVASFRATPGCVEDQITRLCCDAESGRCAFSKNSLPDESVPLTGPVHNTTGLDTARNAPGLLATDGCSGLNTKGPPNPQGQSNDNGHENGSHGAAVVFRPSCTYVRVEQACSSYCYPTCHVDASNQSYSENGVTTFLSGCHIIAVSGSSADGLGSGVTCSAGFAAGVRSCFSCIPALCGVTFSGTGVNIAATNGDVWAQTFSATSGACQ